MARPVPISYTFTSYLPIYLMFTTFSYMFHDFYYRSTKNIYLLNLPPGHGQDQAQHHHTPNRGTADAVLALGFGVSRAERVNGGGGRDCN